MNEEEHILTCLNEECLELVYEQSLLRLAKNADKALRFGLDDRNVLAPDGPTNRERIIDELNDLKGIIAMLIKYEIIPKDWQHLNKQLAKMEKVEKFMLHAREEGALE